MTRFDSPDFTWRRHGPAVNAAGDGLTGVYSAVLHTVPSGGKCKVVIPSLTLSNYYTVQCGTYAGGSVGDTVLVAFDQGKDPWLIVPSVITPGGIGLPKVKTANTGIISVGTFTAGTWVGVTIAHGLGVVPKGFGGHLIGTGSPSIVAGIPVAPANADATNIVFELFNTSAFNLSGGSINVNWWASY